MSVPKRLHVVVIAFPAFGHINPMLELAKKISHFHDVTFAVQAFIVPDFTKRELLHDTDKIELHGIGDPAVNFSGGKSNSSFSDAMKVVIPPLKTLLQDMPTSLEPKSHIPWKPVDAVVVDNFLGHDMDICSQRGVPFYLFNSSNTLMIKWFLALDETIPTMADGEADPFLTLPEPGNPLTAIQAEWKEVFVPMKRHFRLATGTVLNTFRDIERDGVRDVERDEQLAGQPVFCVGPLLPEKEETKAENQLATEKKVTEFLDKHRPNEVVYVSFGSFMVPNPEQLKIVGEALLGLGRPFIWAIGERSWASLSEDITSQIPTQFENPNSTFLMLNWAPQKLILGHAAVSVFLSHCGWNSALESMSNGKPIIAWPLFADQLLAAEFLGKLGVSVLIPGTSIKCLRIVSAQEIQDAIEEVGGWQSGQESSFTVSAKALGIKIRGSWDVGGSSYNEFEDLMKFQSTTKSDRSVLLCDDDNSSSILFEAIHVHF